MSPCVAHYSDGKNAWNVGRMGFLIRNRGIATTIILTIVSMGSAPWWWAFIFPSSLSYWKVLAPIGVIYILFILTLTYLRYRTIRSLEIKYLAHKMVHDLRDRQSTLSKELFSKKSFSKTKLASELKLLLAEVCETASSYFKELVDDKTVEVAIRLAETDIKRKIVVYKTFARSKGLNKNRTKSSEPIPANQGIPRFLRDEKNSQGILFYNNLAEAARQGAYTMTKNDHTYPDEIVTMMVAPLNAWSGNKDNMIGIIYVTSRNNGKFHIKHVDSMAFVADLVATAISNAVQLVNLEPIPVKSKRSQTNV